MVTKKIKEKESFFKKWGVVFVLSLALAIILIDMTLLNVSLATIIRDLHTDIQSIQWVITAYSLTIAALMITGGRLGDLFGRKKMFLVGAAIFAVGSFIASISQNVPTMIVGESIIEGVGAALMMPATASLLVSKYKGRDRGIAFGIWGGVAAASTAIGPLLGGFLTTYYSWRWGFRINIFVAALLIISGTFMIKEYRDTEEVPRLDWIGVLLSAIGMLATVYGIIESSTYGWWNAKKVYSIFGQTHHLWGYSVTPFAVALGLILLTTFVIWEGHQDKAGHTPLVSLKLFENRQFMVGVATTAVLALGQAGLIFSIPVFMQAVRGATAFQTGLTLLPLSITALIAAPLGGFFSHKVAPKRLVQAGLLSSFFGYLLLGQTFNVNAVAIDFAPALILMGAGIGLTMASISNLTLSAVSPKQSGEASGVNNTMRQVGGTLGTAVIGAVLISAISANLISGINKSQKIPEIAKPFINDKISSQESNVEFGGGAKLPADIPKSIESEITKISDAAITDANKEAIHYTTIFAFIGFLVAFLLPGGKDIEVEEDIAVRPIKSD